MSSLLPSLDKWIWQTYFYCGTNVLYYTCTWRRLSKKVYSGRKLSGTSQLHYFEAILPGWQAHRIKTNEEHAVEADILRRRLFVITARRYECLVCVQIGHKSANWKHGKCVNSECGSAAPPSQSCWICPKRSNILFSVSLHPVVSL